MHLGDFDAAATIHAKFSTARPSTGAPFTLAGSPVVSVYKDSSTTQTTSGVTLTVDFDGVTGMHHVAVDTSADGTFYAAGSFFELVLTAGTVDGISVAGVTIARFTIRKNSALKPVTAGRALVVDASGLADATAVKLGPTGAGTALTARDVGASVLLSPGSGTGQVELIGGVVKANLVQILATALTEGAAGRLAAALSTWLNVPTPVATVASINQSGDSFGRIGANGSGLTALATAAQINGLAINTRANLNVPVEIETPDAGTQVWKVRLHLFDVEGNMEAPDSTPTIALTNAAGTDRSSRLSAASNPSTGVYTWDYTASAGDAEEQLVWLFSVVESGVTRTYPATSYVVEETAYRFSSSDRSTLNGIVANVWTNGTRTLTSLGANAPAGWINAGAFTAGAIDAAAIAPNAIGASELAADAVAAIQSGLATAAALATVDDFIDTEVAAIKAVTDKLETALEQDGVVYRFTVNALEQAPAGGGGGSTDWTADERTAIRTILGVPTSGTTPEVPSAGPIKIIDDFLDTEVAAIKAKTDNLPSDPADASDIADAFSTVNSALSIIAGYLDTEIGAIKLVTDRVSGMLVQDGLVYQFTVNALELGPSGSGGGGGLTEQQVRSAVIQAIYGSRAGVLGSAIQAGDVLDVVRTLDFSLDIPVSVGTGTTLVWVVRRCTADSAAAIEIDSTVGLRKLVSVETPQAADGSVARIDAATVKVLLRARSLAMLPIGDYIAELREIEGTTTEGRYEVGLHVRDSAGRQMA